MPSYLAKLTFLTTFFSLILLSADKVEAKEFIDLPAEDPAFEAVNFLSDNGIITGYEDGSFRPGNPVNRAEAVVMIMRASKGKSALDAAGKSVHSDVADDTWYRPSVRLAVDAGVIDGPPAKTAFLPTNSVIKAEFLKIAQLAYGVDTNSFSEIRLPLSVDVADPDEWFYKYMRTALTTSMTSISATGTLDPGRQLTRADVAHFIYRLLMYREGFRTQALLSEAETQILVILKMLEENNLGQAELASTRALLAARGAHASAPDETLVKGAVKVSEAFRSLVQGYKAGLDKDYEGVINSAKTAWALAEEGKGIEPGLATLTEQVQAIASNMAEAARSVSE